ncbi:unnamed protein product [Caenorhabditis auriculariae]|uniref:Uncharacterized protein n=1 Tax=Caenorhabditis auriculariae TaxID=2777116 RepID=A0A8S1H8Q5_9PELO|nr:unnamed protein product [Caenorhabditis auriculariae]
MVDKSPSRASRLWQNVCDVLLCRGDVEETMGEAQPVSFLELFRFASAADIAFFIAGCLCASLGGALQPMVMIIDGWITAIYLLPGDKRGDQQFVDDVTKNLILLAIFGIICFVFCFLQTLFLRRASANICCKLRKEFVSAVLRQDAEWFDETSSGTINSQLNENVDRIDDGLGEKVGMLLRGFIMFISSVVYCAFVDLKLTAICVTMGPLSAIILGLMGKVLSSTAQRIMSTNSKAAGVFEESVMNLKTVASCNAQEHFVEKYTTILTNEIPTVRRYNFWIGFFNGSSLYVILLVMGFSLWYGVHAFHDGKISVAGNVILIIDTISITGYYLSLLGPHVMATVKARAAAAILYQTIDRKQSQPSKEKRKPVESLSGNISFQNVSFKYQSRDSPVLKGLSWEAKAGESVAFVGRSGCGKSTSIALLTKLREATGGRITVDGIPIEEIETSTLRKMIGIVEQEPTLFNGTVMENILLGREVTGEAAVRAAQVAEAHGFISKLSMGYETVLGAHGVHLSGGQKQRIAIARAIVTDPSILLLDEATSALDTSSEKIVQEALNRASSGRTTVIVAHRLSTLKHVDRIYVIDDGVVVESGSHDELLELDGHYAKLAQAQEVGDVSTKKQKSEIRQRKIKKSASKDVDSELEDVEEEESDEGSESDEKNDAQRYMGLRLLYSNMQGYYGKMGLMIVFSLIRALEMPLLSISVYLGFIGLQKTEDYENYAIYAVLLQLVSGFIVMWAMAAAFAMSGWVSEGVTVNLRARALRSLLYRPMSSYDSRSPAFCVSAVSRHAPVCAGAMDSNTSVSLSEFCSVVYNLSIAFIVSRIIGALGVALCALLYFLIFATMYFSNKARNTKSKNDKSGEFSIEVIERSRTIQLLNVESWFNQKYSDYQAIGRKHDFKVDLAEALNQAICNAYAYFNDLTSIALGTYLVYIGHTTPALAFLSFGGVQYAGWSVMYTAPFLPELIRASSAAGQLFKYIDDEEHIDTIIGGGEKPKLSGDVSLQNVFFAYPSRPDVPVSQDLSLSARAGESIALVGPSGGGKSTVVNLLEAFYPVDEGQIKLDSYNLSQINIMHLRRSVGLVQQEPVLFRGTIFENVSLGAGTVTMEEVIKACRTANCDFIESLPTGYETEVGEGGKSLSGGQKQRIAIARTLIRNPRIILLDEATSALDTHSEKIVQQALNDVTQGRTSITIAHRLSSIRHCDRIYFVENGRVVESGTHEELIDFGGHYSLLVNAQKIT